MPKTSLLLRETLSSTSLTSIVAKSQLLRPPFAEYTLNINSSQLDITLLNTPVTQYVKPFQHDEGFESDIDSISLLSSDDSFTSSTCLVEDHVLKHRESDSANGSSSSESDTEVSGVSGVAVGNIEAVTNRTDGSFQSYALSEVLCYTDVNYPKVLLFIIKNEVFVFSFDNLEVLQSFYTSFNTLKAVTNQRTYGRNFNTTFNLLQRTDNNGITHIEIAREPATKLLIEPFETSSIISINTPDAKLVDPEPQIAIHSRALPIFNKPANLRTNNFLDDSKLLLQSELRSSRSEFYPQTSINSFTLRPKSTLIDRQPLNLQKPLENLQHEEVTLKKVWKSADDLLDAPKRPERRRKVKGRAPPPPVDQKQQNIMKGQFIRVAVDPKKPNDHKSSPEIKNNFQTFSSNVQTFTPNWNNLSTPKSPLILTTVGNTSNNTRQTFKQLPTVKLQEYKLKSEQQNWTNSVPRLLRAKPRSKSETRQSTPMAYRYIDTTSKPQNNQHIANTQTISNRLFGLSQKLKEFGNNVVSTNSRNFNFYDGTTEPRRNSLGEMTYKAGSTENNLKSVIKKQVDRKSKSGEKKVTFSAYATVQVV